jgi:hypothetical protein
MKDKYTEYSKFWLGDDFSTEKIDVDDTYGLLKLAGYRRAISNFVYILTGKSIPVRFAEKSTSMTDGKVVYIGGELAKGEFDPTVGLALHEAAHIVKSDFSLIKTLWGKLPKDVTDAAKGKFNFNELGDFCKYILNIVEDRYIDAWVYKAAPGYRGYYAALYNRYFYLSEINQALKSNAFRSSDIKSYKFRLTNLANKHTDLDALPKLRKINEMLDLENILRDEMSTPQARLELALKIAEEIILDVIVDSEKPKNDQKQNGSGDSDDESYGSDFDTESNNSAHSNEKEEEYDGSSNNSNSSDTDDILGGKESSNSSKQEEEKKTEKEEQYSGLSEKKMKRLEKLIQKQEALVNRTNVKSPFDAKILNKLQALEKSGVDIASVGGEEGVPKIECIVVNNLTKELMQTKEFPYTSILSGLSENAFASRGVRAGIELGTMLGRRLQIRSEIKTTKFTRLDKGKIDKRLISTLGYGAENLFYQTAVDKYKNVHLHISVDASSSMNNKWEKTMTTLVAIAKAASMINNVSVCISFRSGVHVSRGRSNEMPYIVMAYDSRKDKFNKITSLFPMLYPNGSTPEGLAFQAILDNIPESTYDTDSYFVNLSDGEPAFNPGYFHETASRHTRKQVLKMVEKGVEVISYYVENPHTVMDVNVKNFKMMYGKDAQFIDTNSVIQIAHTLNRKFLSKAK